MLVSSFSYLFSLELFLSLQIRLVSLSPSYNTTFSGLNQNPVMYRFFHFSWFLLWYLLEWWGPLSDTIFSSWGLTVFGLLAGIGWSVFILKCVCFFTVSRPTMRKAIKVFCRQLLLPTPLRVFHTSVTRWFPTGVWATASLLKSPWLFSIVWWILIMLLSEYSLLFLLFTSLPIPLPILYRLSQVRQSQLVSPSPSCS